MTNQPPTPPNQAAKQQLIERIRQIFYLKKYATDVEAFDAIAQAWLEELEKQHQMSRAMAYRDIATKGGSGNDVRRYAEAQADKLDSLIGRNKTNAN